MSKIKKKFGKLVIGASLLALTSCGVPYAPNPVFYAAEGVSLGKGLIERGVYCKKKAYVKCDDGWDFYYGVLDILDEEGYKIVKEKKSFGYTVGRVFRRGDVEIEVKHGKGQFVGIGKCWVEIKAKRKYCGEAERLLERIKTELAK